jgi:uncharacterized protein (DUF2345 family)
MLRFEDAKLLPRDGETFDGFGVSVAMSEGIAVIGANGVDKNQGAAYVFVHAERTWQEQAKLVASDLTKFLGAQVALSGETLVAGAPRTGRAVGSAHVFAPDGRTWTEQASLVASDALRSDQFGRSVALSADTLVVGTAPVYRPGLAYVFVRADAYWSEQAILSPDDVVRPDDFSESVAVSSDTLFVGSPEDDDNGFNSGSVYVFIRADSTWTLLTKLTASVRSGRFGSSLAVSGDTLVVGSPHDDQRTGAAYVFVRDDRTWIEQARLTASDGVEIDRFGSSLAISGNTIVVGSPGLLFDRPTPGAAYVFAGDGNRWREIAKLLASDGETFDEFGSAVAVSDNTAIVGSIGDDDNGSNAGAAYVFDLVRRVGVEMEVRPPVLGALTPAPPVTVVVRLGEDGGVAPNELRLVKVDGVAVSGLTGTRLGSSQASGRVVLFRFNGEEFRAALGSAGPHVAAFQSDAIGGPPGVQYQGEAEVTLR